MNSNEEKENEELVNRILQIQTEPSKKIILLNDDSLIKSNDTVVLIKVNEINANNKNSTKSNFNIENDEIDNNEKNYDISNNNNDNNKTKPVEDYITGNNIKIEIKNSITIGGKLNDSINTTKIF